MTDLDVSPHPSRLHLAAPADVDEFVTALAAFERGELTADDWRKFRRLRGVYDQRQDGRSMIRVKVPELMSCVARLDVPLEAELGVGNNWDKAH